MWRLEHGPWNGAIEGEIPFRTLRVSTPASGPQSIEFALDPLRKDPTLEPMVSTVRAYRDGELQFTGRVIRSADELKADGATATMSATDRAGLLDRFIVWDADAKSYTGTTRANLSWNLINKSQRRGPDYTLGITNGVHQGTFETYARDVQAGSTVLSNINSMADEGYGFEWTISPAGVFTAYSPNRSFPVWTTLEFGANVDRARRQLAAGDYANVYRFNGDNNLKPVTKRRKDALWAKRGAWEASSGDSIVTSQAKVTQRAEGLLRLSALDQIEYALTLTPGWWGGQDHLKIGDLVWLRLDGGRLREERQGRVVEMGITVNGPSGEETVEIGVVGI